MLIRPFEFCLAGVKLRGCPACAVPYEAIVPEHTQYALFQLYCDLRANPIKDRHWLEVHAKRLKPQTVPGWIVRLPPPYWAAVILHLPIRCLVNASFMILLYLTPAGSGFRSPVRLCRHCWPAVCAVEHHGCHPLCSGVRSGICR